MNTIELNGEVRVASGKGKARQDRASGRTPAVLYGIDEGSLPINLDTRQVAGILRKHGGGTFVLDLKIAGQEERDLKVIIKEIQRDPISSEIVHMDLQHVSLTQLVTVHVPIHLIGTPQGVKEGGVMEHFVREVEVQCEAGRIPDAVEIDVTPVLRGHSVHVRDIPPVDGVTILTPGDRVVITIVTKAVEVEPAPAEEKAEEAVEEKEAAKAEDSSAKQ